VHRLGIDVGGTKVLGVRVDVDGDGAPTVVDHLRTPTPGPEGIIDVLAEVVDRLDPSGSAPVGVGVPGLVDRDGVLCFAPNLGGAVGLEVEALLRARTGRPVDVDNDATCAAWGERQVGAGRGHDDMMLLTLGTGIGGGLVVDGRLLRGAHGFAGELGHVVIEPDGADCPCGQRGCWERYASGGGLERMAIERARRGDLDGVVARAGDPDAVRSEQVVDAARHGDADAVDLLDEVGRWLGRGLASMVNIVDPDVILIGGGLASAGDLVLASARAVLDTATLGAALRPTIPVELAALGDRAGAIGAALLVR